VRPSTAVPAPVALPAPLAPVAAPAPAPAPATPAAVAAPVASRPAIGDTPRPAASGGAAAVMLAEIKDIMEFGASQLDEVKPKVEALVAAHPGTPEAAEAQRLLERSKAAFVQEAEGILKSALTQAEGLLGKRRFDDAAKSFTLVEMRYSESEWYAQVARPRIDGMQGRIRAGKAEFERSGRSLKDDFSNDEVEWDLPDGWERSNGRLVSKRSKLGYALPPMLPGRVVTVSATVRVRARITDARFSGAGIMIFKDGDNLWVLRLLIRDSGKLNAELHEKMAGRWAAQQREPKLGGLGWTDRGWEYGRSYRLKIELKRDTIRGRITDMDGKVCTNIGYKFDNPAITSGRPGLRSSGCDVEFDDFEAQVFATE
jgi:hypothetical protein